VETDPGRLKKRTLCRQSWSRPLRAEFQGEPSLLGQFSLPALHHPLFQVSAYCSTITFNLNKQGPQPYFWIS